jgi:hypothetical protein
LRTQLGNADTAGLHLLGKALGQIGQPRAGPGTRLRILRVAAVKRERVPAVQSG